MPALLTHYTFALETIQDKRYQPVVNLGTQGPDTFMAYGSVPWRKREDVKKIQGLGHLLHRIDIGPSYWKMVEYAKGNKDEELLFAYIDGILMHYCLDRLMHAYIFYRTGVDETGGLSGYYSWSHGFFEAILDKEFATERGTYTKLPDCIKVEKEEAMAISKMWAEASPTPIKEETFLYAYEDFHSAEALLWNPLGIKRPLFRLLGKYKTPFTQVHPISIKRFVPLDVTNKKKAMWKNPATGEESFDSVDELFNKAKEDYFFIHDLLLRAKKGEDTKEEFLAFTATLNHEGGPVGKKKHLYDLCWKVLGKKKYLPKEK